MMKAVIRRQYGSLEVADVPEPVPGKGQALLKVTAAGVDPGVWHLMAGLPLVVRPVLGLPRPRQPILGGDVAGTVVATGPGVDLPVGSEVFGVADGSFAEYAVAKAATLVPRPANVTAVEAAAVPTSAVTARQAVAAAHATAGQRALVIGAGGGVGVYAVQLLAARGLDVTAVCSAGKAELVRSLGASHVIDHRATPELGRGYDVIIEMAGLRSIRSLRAALTPRGAVVTVGGEDDGRWVGGGLRRGIRGAVLSPFVRHRIPWLIVLTKRPDLLALAELLAAGTLRPVVGRTFPLAETPEALRLLVEGRAAGKYVIVV